MSTNKDWWAPPPPTFTDWKMTSTTNDWSNKQGYYTQGFWTQQFKERRNTARIIIDDVEKPIERKDMSYGVLRDTQQEHGFCWDVWDIELDPDVVYEAMKEGRDVIENVVTRSELVRALEAKHPTRSLKSAYQWGRPGDLNHPIELFHPLPYPVVSRLSAGESTTPEGKRVFCTAGQQWGEQQRWKEISPWVYEYQPSKFHSGQNTFESRNTTRKRQGFIRHYTLSCLISAMGRTLPDPMYLKGGYMYGSGWEWKMNRAVQVHGGMRTLGYLSRMRKNKDYRDALKSVFPYVEGMRAHRHGRTAVVAFVKMMDEEAKGCKLKIPPVPPKRKPGPPKKRKSRKETKTNGTADRNAEG